MRNYVLLTATGLLDVVDVSTVLTTPLAEMDLLIIVERNAFMDGKKLIAIISDAASTGISLQVNWKSRKQCFLYLHLR